MLCSLAMQRQNRQTFQMSCINESHQIQEIQEHQTFVVIDLFCGAGGTSLGFTEATHDGKPIAEVIACVNHDEVAIRSHSKNFPNCKHFTEDIRTLDVSKLPKKQPDDKRIWILWASLECTHFSNAKSGARDNDSRTLANALFAYIDWINPDLIQIENVREFMSWGELDEKGKPISRKKGIHYIQWRQKVESFGYRYRSQLLNSADFGAYQSRIRYFAVFAKPNMPIVFPQRSHDKDAKEGLMKHNPVRDVLNLDVIGKSIFERKKDLSSKTLKRILAGLIKFVPSGVDEYLIRHYGGEPSGNCLSLERPAPTVTTIPHESLVHVRRANSFLIQYNGIANGSVTSKDVPCRTLTTRDRFGLVSFAFIDNQFGTGVHSSIDEPCGTLTTIPKRNLVTVKSRMHYLMNPQYTSSGGDVTKPCFTLIAKMDKKPPYLVTVDFNKTKTEPIRPISFYKDESISVKERILAFMEDYQIESISMRMFDIVELKKIQGFPADYILEGTKADQKKFIGNAVVPVVVSRWAEQYFREINLINNHQLTMF